MTTPPQLSPQETRVLEGWSRSATDKDICDALGISGSTLRTYLTRIRLKTGCTSRFTLGCWWIKHCQQNDDMTALRKKK